MMRYWEVVELQSHSSKWTGNGNLLTIFTKNRDKIEKLAVCGKILDK